MAQPNLNIDSPETVINNVSQSPPPPPPPPPDNDLSERPVRKSPWIWAIIGVIAFLILSVVAVNFYINNGKLEQQVVATNDSLRNTNNKIIDLQKEGSDFRKELQDMEARYKELLYPRNLEVADSLAIEHEKQKQSSKKGAKQ